VRDIEYMYHSTLRSTIVDYSHLFGCDGAVE
jgi:hypothetical protein